MTPTPWMVLEIASRAARHRVKILAVELEEDAFMDLVAELGSRAVTREENGRTVLVLQNNDVLSGEHKGEFTVRCAPSRSTTSAKP